MKFIENHYYSLSPHGGEIKYYFQFKEKTRQTIYTTGYIIDLGNYRYNLGIKIDDDDLYKEVDFVEIVDYLPDDNSDKIVYLRKKKIKNLLENNI